ncbi:hypothetical protein VOI54_03775 [Tamlana sp. 2201CG12-4]|uniref:4-fold beta flower protein n=1 Tax=Tamlana sp. 2201CG12-4 TaxID=3112582 RepID=UPI002DB72618|nr:hypothetical protein [Tamlana sp. 2201CG12-4]MEC3906122.1 hypothetical protein [Tamlana sp. 2201CG12-4]
MQSIYNKKGKTVGWLSNEDIYDVKGDFIGYIKNNAVYNRSSEYCGSLNQSVFRDRNGYVVAFMGGATKLRVLPALKPAPTKPNKKRKPHLKKPSSSSTPKSIKLGWSSIGWDSFI